MGGAMEYDVRVQQVAPQMTGVVRLRARQDELARVIPAACGEVWEFFRAAGLPRPGRHLALYLDCEMNIECGVEVVQPFPGNDRVVCSQTPAGAGAPTAPLGPYGRAGGTPAPPLWWGGARGRPLARGIWGGCGPRTQ